MSPKQSKKRHSAVPPKTTEARKATAASAVRDAAEATIVVSKEVPAAAIDAAAAAEVVATATPQVATATQVEAASVSEKTTETTTAPIVASAPSEEVASLIAGLGNVDADIARDAAVALGQAGDKTAVPALIESLTNLDGYTHPVVRAAAAASLGQLGDARATEALLNALRDPMAEASAEAVRALAALGATGSVQSLIDVVRNTDGFFAGTVRRAAVAALAKLGGPLAAAELRAVAADQFEDSLLREEAAAACNA